MRFVTRALIGGALAALAGSLPSIPSFADAEKEKQRKQKEREQKERIRAEIAAEANMAIFNRVLETENRAGCRRMLCGQGRAMIKGWKFFRLKKQPIAPAVATPKIYGSDKRRMKREALAA